MRIPSALRLSIRSSAFFGDTASLNGIFDSHSGHLYFVPSPLILLSFIQLQTFNAPVSFQVSVQFCIIPYILKLLSFMGPNIQRGNFSEMNNSLFGTLQERQRFSAKKIFPPFLNTCKELCVNILFVCK